MQIWERQMDISSSTSMTLYVILLCVLPVKLNFYGQLYLKKSCICLLITFIFFTLCFVFCGAHMSDQGSGSECYVYIYLIFCIANRLPWYHLRCIPNQLPYFTLPLQTLHFMKSRHAVPQFWTPKWLWLQEVPIVRVTGWVKLCDCSPEMQLASLLDRGQRQGTVKD